MPQRQTERDTYGGTRGWQEGAGERWTSKQHRDYGHAGRQTDPESARWFGSDAHAARGGVLRQLAEELGFKRPGPWNYERSDERIREDVCERLWRDERLDVGDVSVDVKDGVVTLEGQVTDRRMKHAIEDIAAHCGGVQDVENRIRVNR